MRGVGLSDPLYTTIDGVFTRVEISRAGSSGGVLVGDSRLPEANQEGAPLARVFDSMKAHSKPLLQSAEGTIKEGWEFWLHPFKSDSHVNRAVVGPRIDQIILLHHQSIEPSTEPRQRFRNL